uniref:Uncharacterized protein n=1 Tax=Romanomermis culicivorax TaxID=13658 RepID=A0A915KQZ2_ROMCU
MFFATFCFTAQKKKFLLDQEMMSNNNELGTCPFDAFMFILLGTLLLASCDGKLNWTTSNSIFSFGMKGLRPRGTASDTKHRVKLARLKWDIVMPKIRPNLNEVDPETEQQWLERIQQDQEQLQQLERAPEMSNQELAMQLQEFKGTVEALFDIMANSAREDNKGEAESP